MKMATINFFIIFLICFPEFIFSEEILGCGGFVKSDIEINFSKVEVKLYTKQGSLKEKTDCAPNNGYYFLPLYDKGDYLLKIEPPIGWTFEPKEVSLNVDGISDPCTKGQDINFVFKGFAIIGKVESSGSQTGPKGVRLQLVQEADKALVFETISVEGGGFQFTPVPPGNYVVKASHPKWRLSKDVVKVQLGKGNVELADRSIVVSGYDVSGSVTSDDEPIKGVSFVLFQTDGQSLTNVPDCDTSVLPGFQSSGTPLCHVLSDEKGIYAFPSLPPGRYRIVPHYEGPQSIKFDVRPPQVDFTVAHDSLKISTSFQVKGFSVSGKILLQPNGKGVADATVLLDGVVKSVTKSDGTYHLENMQAGTYILQVQANNIKFQDMPVKITPNTPQLAPIYPSSFKVCGTIAPHQLTPGGSDQASRSIHINKAGGSSEPLSVHLDTGSGDFCQFLEPGKYEAGVEVTDFEKSRGLQFIPTSHIFEVTDRPILDGIVFSQLKAHLSGEIICLVPNSMCGDIPINIRAIPTGTVDEIVPVGITVARGNTFTFSDILPGKYQVSIDKENWCWEAKTHIVAVGAAEAKVPPFKQTGFAITINSSHDTQVQYKLPNSDLPPNTLTVKRGQTKSCLTRPGTYEFTPIGCHSYAQTSVRWSTNVSPPVTLKFNAISHSVGGCVRTHEKVSDLYIDVISVEDEKLKRRLGPLRADAQPDGRMEYKFQLQVAEGERLMFVPSAGILLFNPVRSSLAGPADCVENAVEFYAEKGRIIEGYITPKLAGVKVTVKRRENAEEIIASAETAADGRFKFGPLPGGTEYSVTAEKEGYVMTGPDANGNFNAHKLAEVIVEVVDKADGQPLQGVLLSLSGGESFRRNSQTGPDGKMTFSSLSPNEYYLRPMMKEYRFEPPSKMITVVEGATVNVQLQGLQVAFSVYGTVTSLGGEPEEGIVVEAVGREGCSQYQEESSTEVTGQFRIRGLQPECEYTIRVKQGPAVNQHIQRSTPDGILVKTSDGDITGIKLIVFHPVTQMDLTAHVQAPTAEQLRTLKAKLCREDAPDSPVHVVKLEPLSGKGSRGNNAAMIMFPSIPVDGRGYFLQLESTLSRATFTYTTHAIHFRANSSFKHVRLVFKPEPKVTEQELGHSSYVALPLILIGVLLYTNRSKVIPVLNRMVQSLNGSLSQSSAAGNNGRNSTVSSEHNAVDAVMVEPVLNVRSRKVKPRKT